MAQGNRIYVKTATVGTGTVTLGAVVSAQFNTFADASIVDGAFISSYIIEEGTDFEIGVGTYNSAGPTLTRTRVRMSRIGGVVSTTTKMTLAGNATVRVVAAAEDVAGFQKVAAFGAVGNAITGDYTVSITSGAAALTAVGAAFTANDVGKTLVLPGAGAAGAVLVTTIASFTDATHIGLGNNASTTLTSVLKTVLYGTDDTAAIQAAVNYVVNNNLGLLLFDAGQYLTTSQILVDQSAISSSRQLGRITLRGVGVASAIINKSSATSILKMLGNASNSEAYFAIEQLRLLGGLVTGSKGIEINIAAFGYMRGVVVEAFDYGFDGTDVEQFGIYDSNFRYSNQNMRFNGAVSVTDTNSILLSNVCIGNSNVYGLQVTHANNFKMVEGSIQYNGVVGGGSGQFGAKFIESGTGYGIVDLDSVAIEGNGGISDLIFDQTTNPARINIKSCGFMRTDLTTKGYGTNQLLITGTNADTIIKLSCNTFKGSGYTPNAGRPTIALTNTACLIDDDGTNEFQNATEKLTYPAAQLVPKTFGAMTAKGLLALSAGVTGLNNLSWSIGGVGIVMSGATFYLTALGVQAASNLTPWQAPAAGIITSFQVYLDSAPGVGKTLTFTIFKDGVATAMTGTISGSGGFTVTVTTNPVSFSLNSEITLQVVGNAGAATTSMRGRVVYSL